MKKVFKIIRNFVLVIVVTSILAVIVFRFVPVYFTPLMIIRSVEAVKEGKVPKIKKDWVSIDAVSQNMVQAVVASEDNLFMEHHGFDTKAIEKALEHNEKSKRIHGGSTISQQTAKNVFLWPGRSWVRKGLEAYFTVLIELIWTKERIMEVYLNVIETGDGIYGVQAASKTYFGCNASKLTRSQAALIAVCLPNPRRFNPAKPSGYILRRKNTIVNLMGKLNKVDFK